MGETRKTRKVDTTMRACEGAKPPDFSQRMSPRIIHFGVFSDPSFNTGAMPFPADGLNIFLAVSAR